MTAPLDAVIVGSGPNGLAAAITLARAGLSVKVYEAADTAGGGLRSAALTAPDAVHDVCAAVHATALISPFMRLLPLADHGVEFLQPPAPFAHPLDDGTAVVAERSVADTAANLGGSDAAVYRQMVDPLTARAEALTAALLEPPSLRGALLTSAFALKAVRSATSLAGGFRGERGRALIAGAAAHSMLPLNYAATAGYALVMNVSAHAVGFPIVRGGSQRLADALVACLRSLGGEVVTGTRISKMHDLPPSRATLFDTSPRQLLSIAGDRVPPSYVRAIAKFRYGPGVFKMDWLLNGPVPWRARESARAGTIHIGGTLAEIARSEDDAFHGRVSDRPYMIVVQPSAFDASRAPAGRHVLWGYCHVPHGADVDMRARMEAQIERFAPGFRDCIAAAHAMSPADIERHNPNYIGGDIACGVSTLRQTFVRPVLRLDPHVTPIKDVYLCSSATPPGIGVHGMCGHRAAQAALRRTFGRAR
ncbi:MAG TPA: NAD(P)/FAD-dependent oxidoreductase [Vicinamibacterales bacterium]|nr:NAD(P)/FAD-dependent oxidoreductase [Vicinamibacterales bacterium]